MAGGAFRRLYRTATWLYCVAQDPGGAPPRRRRAGPGCWI